MQMKTVPMRTANCLLTFFCPFECLGFTLLLLELMICCLQTSILPALSLLLTGLIKPAISEWVLIPFLAFLLPFLYLIQPMTTPFEYAFSSSLHHSCSGLYHLIPHFTQGSKWSLSQPYLSHFTLFFPQLLVFGNALNETYILSLSSPRNLPLPPVLSSSWVLGLLSYCSRPVSSYCLLPADSGIVKRAFSHSQPLSAELCLRPLCDVAWNVSRGFRFWFFIDVDSWVPGI